MSEIVRGLLGWSNKRAGLEFYRFARYALETAGRWVDDRREARV